MSSFSHVVNVFQPLKEPLNKVTLKVRKPIDRKIMESKLAEIITISNKHRATGVPRGDARYKTLFSLAQNRVRDFSVRYDVSETQIYTQMPALGELEEYSKPVSAGKVASRGIGAIVGAVIALFVAGLVAGAGYEVFIHGFHLFVKG